MTAETQLKQIVGFDFELTVHDQSAGYFGSWFCRECWYGGVNYELLPGADDAMLRAEQGAMQHYETEHKSRRPAEP